MEPLVVDLPHRFTTAATYDLPVGKSKLLPVNNSVLNFLWATGASTPITVIQAGFPWRSLRTVTTIERSARVYSAEYSRRRHRGGGSPEDHAGCSCAYEPYLQSRRVHGGALLHFRQCSAHDRLASRPAIRIGTFRSSNRSRFVNGSHFNFRAEALNAFQYAAVPRAEYPVGNSNFGAITQGRRTFRGISSSEDGSRSDRTQLWSRGKSTCG